MGERFLQLRWHRPDSEVAGEWAIRQQGQESAVRNEAREAIGEIFARACTEPPVLSDEQQKRIASLAEVVAIARTHVYRSSFGSREIEYVPEPEANTRISKGLAAIAKGVAAVNRHEEVGEEDLQDAFRVGLDCLPPNRREILLTIWQDQAIDSVHIPRTQRDRAEEELRELGILEQGVARKVTVRVGRLLSQASGSVDMSMAIHQIMQKLAMVVICDFTMAMKLSTDPLGLRNILGQI